MGEGSDNISKIKNKGEQGPWPVSYLGMDKEEQVSSLEG